jgi:hypothetical protein
MANKIKETKNTIKSKIEAVKRINDDLTSNANKSFDKFLTDIPSTETLFGKKLSDFAEKRKKKVENKKDVFADLIDVVEGFLGSNKKFEGSEKEFSKQRLKQITQQSLHLTINDSKKIMMDSVNKILFVGDGICGTNKTFPVDSITLSPNEFDFMNVLTVDPSSNSGQIVYEKPSPDKGFVKMNRVLYSGFTTNQTFTTKDNTNLFDISWNSTPQNYTVSGLSSISNVETLMSQYYSNIEHIDLSGVTKTAMLMTLQGDPNDPPLFDKGFNDLNRLLSKICPSCGNPSNGLNQNSPQFNENDEDVEFYFDFDDVEGIDLDDEDNRYKKVLKFKDCNEFKIPSNPTHFEDFVYLTNKQNLNESVSNALLNAATDAHDQSGGSIPLDNFHISILNNFILNLPKALIGTILSPKYIFPIVVAYKAVITNGEVNNVKSVMKKLSKLFNEIIKNILWKFISEFWKLVKMDLLIFLQSLALKILKNKNKRYYLIVATLIALLTKILESGIGDCKTLYSLINNSIDLALKGGKSSIPVPGFLLSFSDLSTGYSQDRAFMNITQKLESSGISMAPIFGEPNNLVSLVKSVVDGHTEEMDANSFIKVANKEIILPSPMGPIVIPPGLLNSSGKMF